MLISGTLRFKSASVPEARLVFTSPPLLSFDPWITNTASLFAIVPVTAAVWASESRNHVADNQGCPATANRLSDRAR